MTHLILNTRDELININLENMVYACTNGNYVTFFFLNGQKEEACMTLQSLENFIAKAENTDGKGVHRFIRIGWKYIIQYRLIMKINLQKQTLTLSDMDRMTPVNLPVPKETLKRLKQAMTSQTNKNGSNSR